MNLRKSVIILLLLVFAIGVFSLLSAGKSSDAKNVILMVPDGMTLKHVTATRTLVNGSGGEALAMEKLPEIGYVRNYAKNSTVTDSAAAASAYATGEKYNNKEVSCHSKNGELLNCVDEPKTILEIAKSNGKSTGLVVTSQVSHATPAAFASHVPVRYCGAEITRQYIEETKVDVVLGGGVYKTSKEYNCQQYEDSYNNLQSNKAMSKRAEENGYVVVDSKAKLETAVDAKADKLFGLFTGYKEGKTPEMFRLNQFGLKNEKGKPFSKYPEGEPTLSEMTKAALDTLEEDTDGFFLLVEGSQIDWANHGNDFNYMLAEMLAYNKTVKAVQDWINEYPFRKEQTLLISVGDHDTGGFAINGPYGSRAKQGEKVKAAWTTDGHTGEDLVMWSQGPGSQLLGRPLENTDVFHVMKQVIE